MPFPPVFCTFVTADGAGSHDLARAYGGGRWHREPTWLGGLGQLVASWQLGDVAGPRSRTKPSQGGRQ